MEIVSDLHLHSKFSRAVSPVMNLQTMNQFAAQKGIDLVTTGDWTHPVWMKEIQTMLEETAEGIYTLKVDSSLQVQAKQSISLNEIATSQAPRKDQERQVKFLLSTEIASIYKQGDKLRRIHSLMFAPNVAVALKVNQALIKKGCNLSSDGRPIVGLSVKNLLELLLNLDERCMLIPCHVWTPHFGVYGSASGFDSLDEAFGDLAKYVYAIETGISSDPGMNWHIKELENRSIVSFSDAHSAPKMGREATVFASRKNGIPNNFSYDDIRRAIMRDKESTLEITYTIEFYPEEGKYHYAGHRNCKVSLSPEDVQAKGNICPVCHKKVTEGVLQRVQQLAYALDVEKKDGEMDQRNVQWFTDPTNTHPPYVKLVPLLEIIAESLHSTVQSQKTKDVYTKLCQELGGELDILLRTSGENIALIGGERVCEGIKKVREGSIVIIPGYDGEYGKVSIWDKKQSTQSNAKPRAQLSIDF